MAEQSASQTLQSLIDRNSLRPVQVGVLALCALITFVEGIDLTLIPLLAPRIVKDWALTSEQLGVILSAGAFGLIFGGLSVGWLADRIGRRGALVSAMALMTLATLATAFVKTVPELIVCRVIAGIAFGGVIPGAVSLVSELLPSRMRPSVVAMVILGQAAGALVAGLLLKLPFAQAAQWQGLVLYTAMSCGFVTLVILALLPESPRYLGLRNPGSPKLGSMLRSLGIDSKGVVYEPDPPARGWRLAELFTPQRAYGTALLWLTFIGVGWPLSFFTNWLTKMYTEVGHEANVGIDAMNAYSLGAIFGGLLLPLFSRRWHHDRVLMATILASAVATAWLGLALTGTPSVYMTLSFMCGVFVSGTFFMLYPPAVRFYPTDIRATGVGAAVAFGRVGNTFSPTVAGYMLGAGLAPKSVFFAMAAPLLLSFTALYLFHRHTVVKAARG
jgi:MFS transporter, AAHS family, 4-hydroxybenzoate transporter